MRAGRAAPGADQPGMTVLSAMAAEVVARATLRAVLAARSIDVLSGGVPVHFPSASELAAAR